MCMLKRNCFFSSFSSSGPSVSACITPSPHALEATTVSDQYQHKKRKLFGWMRWRMRYFYILKNNLKTEQGRRKRRHEDHFGKHVAAKLKRLPNRTRAMAQLRIEEVLINAEFPKPEASYDSYNHF